MVFLFMNEFYSYTKIKTASEMYIDVNRGGDKVLINNLAYYKRRYRCC